MSATAITTPDRRPRRPGPGPGFGRILEAAYATGLNDAAWLDAVTGELAGQFDQGAGLLTFSIRGQLSDLDRGTPIGERGLGQDAVRIFEETIQLLALAPARVQKAFLQLPVGTTLADVMPLIGRPLRARTSEMLASHGWRDAVGLNAIGADGHGIIAAAPARRPTQLRPQRRGSLERLSRMLATACTVRRRSQKDEQSLALQAARRRGLRWLGRALAVACPETADDRDLIERKWREALAGGATIVDRFRVGRREYVLVQDGPVEPLSRREQAVAGLAALGQSNKTIGAQLGLSVGAVGRYLKSAGCKLGVATRSALIRRLALDRESGAFGSGRP